jgi:hypothetical protein
MDEDRLPDQLSDYFSRIGKKGGHARAKVMTAEQRKASATKASKVAAKVRSKKARERRGPADIDR